MIRIDAQPAWGFASGVYGGSVTLEVLAHTLLYELSAGTPAHLLSDSLFQTVQHSFLHADSRIMAQIRTAKVLISRFFLT
jgi:hypothetical protein